MPTKRGDFAIGVVGGKLVCAGGLGKIWFSFHVMLRKRDKVK